MAKYQPPTVKAAMREKMGVPAGKKVTLKALAGSRMKGKC